MYAYMHARMHACIYLQIHRYMHTYIHMYMVHSRYTSILAFFPSLPETNSGHLVSEAKIYILSFFFLAFAEWKD
jgi:hypothetical protein